MSGFLGLNGPLCLLLEQCRLCGHNGTLLYLVDKRALRQVNLHPLEHTLILMRPAVMRRVLIDNVVIIYIPKVFLNLNSDIGLMPLVVVEFFSPAIYLGLGLLVIFCLFKFN